MQECAVAPKRLKILLTSLQKSDHIVNDPRSPDSDTSDHRSNYCGNINANNKSGNNDRKARNLEHVYRQVRNKKPSPAPAKYTPVGSLVKHKVNKFSLMYDDGVYFNTGISEYEEDKNELYLVHYSDDGEVTSNIVAMCSDEDEDTKGRSVAEIGEEFMSYYAVGDNVDSSTKSMIKIGNTDAFYATVKSSDGDFSVAATQHIYFARHGNKVYTLIALHLDDNEKAVTKALEYTLGSMSFDNSLNT